LDGYDSILVVVDHGLTKGVILTPCKKTIKADGVADILSLAVPSFVAIDLALTEFFISGSRLYISTSS